MNWKPSNEYEQYMVDYFNTINQIEIERVKNGRKACEEMFKEKFPELKNMKIVWDTDPYFKEMFK